MITACSARRFDGGTSPGLCSPQTRLESKAYEELIGINDRDWLGVMARLALGRTAALAPAERGPSANLPARRDVSSALEGAAKATVLAAGGAAGAVAVFPGVPLQTVR